MQAIRLIYHFSIPQLPGALQSLKFAQQVHGKQHIELVPPLLLLAEVNLGKWHHLHVGSSHHRPLTTPRLHAMLPYVGLNSLKQAERHLSRGNWIILKNPTARLVGGLVGVLVGWLVGWLVGTHIPM